MKVPPHSVVFTVILVFSLRTLIQHWDCLLKVTRLMVFQLLTLTPLNRWLGLVDERVASVLQCTRLFTKGTLDYTR